MNEYEKIEELLDEKLVIPEEEQKSLNHKVRNGIARSIYTRILITALVIASGIFIIRYAADAYRQSAAWHLNELEMLEDEDILQESFGDAPYNTETVNARLYLSMYIELFAPGYKIVYPDYSSPVSNVEYGTYEISGSVINYFSQAENPFALNRSDVICDHMTLKDGKIVLDDDVKYNLFKSDRFRLFWTAPLKYLRVFPNNSYFSIRTDEIESLPDSAYVEMDVYFYRELTVGQFCEMIADHKDSRIEYAVTHILSDTFRYTGGPITYSRDTFEEPPVLGFSLVHSNNVFLPSEEMNEKYPKLALPPDEYGYMQIFNHYWNIFQDRDQMAEYSETFIDHYRSALSLLVNNHVLSEEEESCGREVLDDMEENDLTVKGVRMICTKEDALKWMTDMNTRAYKIENAKWSRYEK